ncbi:MAG: hypothetical protein ACPL08_08465 [Dictyoglomus turgidum]
MKSFFLKVLHLQVVKWEDDWTIMGINGELMSLYRKLYRGSKAKN